MTQWFLNNLSSCESSVIGLFVSSLPVIGLFISSLPVIGLFVSSLPVIGCNRFHNVVNLDIWTGSGWNPRLRSSTVVMRWNEDELSVRSKIKEDKIVNKSNIDHKK